MTGWLLKSNERQLMNILKQTFKFRKKLYYQIIKYYST